MSPASPLSDRILPLPPLPALAPTPPLAPPPPRAEPAPELWEAHGLELEHLAESHAHLADTLAVELAGLADELPQIADLGLDETLAAEMAESAAALAGAVQHQLAPSLEVLSEETRLEVERLGKLSAEIAQRLPSAEEMERLRAQTRQLRDSHERALERHRVQMMRLTEEERVAREHAREEIQRSLEERRELVERARQERLEGIRAIGERQRLEYRQILRQTREELREQLQLVEQELEREDEGRERGVPE